MDYLRPSQVLDIGESYVSLDLYRYRFLAEGDSWFSLGDTLAPLTSNIVLELLRVNTAHDVVVNCASPGETLRRMVDALSDPNFNRLLDGVQQRRWDALLLSAGGNDLIEACALPADHAPADRLLLRPEERVPNPSAGRDYVSPAGWERLAGYLRHNLATLMQRRDRSKSRSGDWKAPIFLHTYHRPVVRDAPTGGGGPWLYRALAQAAFAIPPAHRQMVSDELFGRLRSTLLGLHSPADRVYVFDSYGAVELQAAAPEAHYASGDWLNEIHLTAPGYRKLAEKFQPFIDSHLP